jgi:ADP-ribose pyrophosphatase YjhB (NUDIX family)
VIEENEQYLVIAHSNGKCAFPGGFMRWHEEPAEAVKRECKEETGLELHIVDVIGYHAIVSHRFDRMSTLVILYQGKVVEGPLRPSREGQPYWVHERELREKLDPIYVDILDDYLRFRTQHSPPNVSS